MSSAAHAGTPYYFVPAPSAYPVLAATGLFFVILGAGQWINGADWGAVSLAFGMAMWLGVLFFWFRAAVARSGCAV
jgi:cytochrome c oxidase subunit 3